MFFFFFNFHFSWSQIPPFLFLFLFYLLKSPFLYFEFKHLYINLNSPCFNWNSNRSSFKNSELHKYIYIYTHTSSLLILLNYEKNSACTQQIGALPQKRYGFHGWFIMISGRSIILVTSSLSFDFFNSYTSFFRIWDFSKRAKSFAHFALTTRMKK